MNIKKLKTIFAHKYSLLLFLVALFFVVGLQIVSPGVLKSSRVEAATSAENKATAAAQKYCDNISPGNTDADTACKKMYVEFYLGDQQPQVSCPGSGTDYNWCVQAAKYGKQQAGKDFPDFTQLCPTFISNNSGGNWPDFSSLNNSQQQKAIDACNKGVAEGYVYTPGYYPSNEVCTANYSGDNTLLKACEAGESLVDAHIFSPSEVKTIAKSGSLAMTDNSNDTASGAGGSSAGSSGSSATAPTCDSGSFSFNWALCPIFDGTSAVTQWIFTNLIQPLLMTNPICLDASAHPACDNTIYRIWSGFRIYGDIFLVIVLLVIVFGESIGGGMIDAYTAKKVLPRLLIAAILINLSIYIVSLLIDITNVVGGGLGGILTAPLGTQGAFTIQPSGITQGAVAAFGTTGLLVGAFALGVTGIALLLVGLIITGAIAMVGIFITLILRQTIILGLLLISPVAFALWCLPNTESWFKRWWDTLFQMLLVYPIIITLFAVADVMSYVTSHNNANGAGGVLSGIVAYMLLIIPLYLVPFTLRSANRLLGSIHGAVSNVGKQINGFTGKRALAGASQEANKNLSAAGNYSRFSNRNALTRGINTLTGTAAHPRSVLRGRRGVRAARQAHQTTQGAEAVKEDAIFQANQGDDKFLLAVANRDLAEQKLSETRQKFEDARSRGDMAGMASAQSTMDAQQHALDTAAQMGRTGRTAGVRYQALQGLAKTGFQFEGGAEGYAELSDTVRQLSGGDERAYSAMMNESQYNLRTAGRYDLGGINDGAGYSPGSGVSKASLYELANAKPDTMKGLMESLPQGPSAGAAGHQHAIAYQELQAMLPNSKGATRDAIIESMRNLEGRGVKNYMAQDAGTGETTERRVNYDSTNPAHATGWSTAERTRGWRTEKRAVTRGDLAGKEARTYERPNPEHI